MVVAPETQLLLVGERQGVLVGRGASKAKDGDARVFSVFHEIVAPRSPATGLSTGKRHHKLLTFRRNVSAATVGIQQAFATMENLTEVSLRFFQSSPLGVPQQVYTIQLFNAHICALRMLLPPTRSLSATNRERALFEEVSLAYLTIHWTWQDPLMSASDDWLVAR